MLKRTFDLVGAALGLVVSAPLFLLAALMVVLEDGRPVFFRQVRVGREARLFHMWKFRTMVPDAERRGRQLTVGEDPRITQVGRWLRRTKIDELPQLVNVLAGHMSFTGPRPEVPHYVRLYNERQRRVLELMPGITDPASLAYFDENELLGGVADPEAYYVKKIMPAKIRLNLEYAAGANFARDLVVIAMTIKQFALRLVTELPELPALPSRYRRIVVALIQLGLVALSSYTAMWLRFDGAIPARDFRVWLNALWWLLAIRGLTFAWFRLYQGLWRYASLWDLRNIVAAVSLSSVAHYLLIHRVFGWTSYPRSVFFIDAGLLVLLMGGVRMVRRTIGELRHEHHGRRVLVYGAGDAGQMIVHDMRTRAGHSYVPLGFVDDDPGKIGLRIHGVPVLGTGTSLPRIMAKERPEEVLVAIPRADPATFRRVVRSLDRYNVPIKTLPNLREILDNRVELNKIRNLSLEDLLSRRPVGLDQEALRVFLKGRRVMVTGAGGSIGSELCRQVAALGAARLVMLDHAENGLYAVANELADRGYRTAVRSVIADVTDAPRMEQVMRQHRPEIVFHAAAHKHVPLMEENPCEAVKNNVTGTRTVAETAERCNVDRFVFISTDKAVNPTSVMGATKRVVELLLQTQGAGSGTTFVTVRFGNVLSSSGSVVPRFLEQIKAGGPVTVTHPDMRRFFMLTREAVQLVLHAAAEGENGCLYVLEMGNQVKLVDLARDLIRLAGFVPEAEIPITFVGLRPGEKLYEELFGEDEVAAISPMEDIMAARATQLPPRDVLVRDVARLESVARTDDADAVLEQLGTIVPAYGRRKEQPVEAAAPSVMDLHHLHVPEPAPPMLPEQGQHCPMCGSSDVHRSRTRSRSEDVRKSLSLKRPYRCHACSWRGWLVPMDHDHEAAGGFPVPADAVLDATPDLEALDDMVSVGATPPRRPFAPRDVKVP